jgi:hypothetical protein
MQGILLFLFALFAVISAQAIARPDSGAGCCFFRKANFQDEIRCTSEPFTIADVNSAIRGKETVKKDGIGSFFCTQTYSAAIQNNAVIEELVDCGDVVNETTSPIPVERIEVGECIQRRCCFYTGKDKDGDEFCINTDESPADELPRVQAAASFAVAECLEDWKIVAHARDGKVINIACGETLDLPAGTIFTRVTTSPCARPRAEMETVEDPIDVALDQAVLDATEEFVVDPLVDQVVDEALDQAVVESTEDSIAVEQIEQVTESVVEQAVADFDHDLDLLDQVVDQAVVESTEDAVVVDPQVDQVVDQALDQAVLDFEDPSLAEQQQVDQAVFDELVLDDVQFLDSEVDSAVLDFEDPSLADQQVDQAIFDDQFFEADPLDQAVMDEASFGDANIDPALVGEGYDQAFMDESFSDFVDETNFDQNY